MTMPEYITEIIEKLHCAGFSAYAVGGCVRDTVLHRTPRDWDVATSARPESVENLFPVTSPTGIKYGTITVGTGERRCHVTTFRTDGEYKNSRSPERVSFTDDLKGDLMRRDFTINAMAADIDGNIIDPFGGLADVESGIVRCVGNPDDRFKEDALRMLRAVRFAAVLGFKIEERTLSSILNSAGNSAGLSAERIRDELLEILGSDRPGEASLLISSGLLCPYSLKRSVSLERLAEIPAGSYSRIITAAYILEREKAVPDGEKFLSGLRLPGKAVILFRRSVETLRHHRGSWERTASAYGTQEARHAAWMIGGNEPDKLASALASGRVITERELAVNGNFLMGLGITGSDIGRAKKFLASAVSAGEAENTTEGICFLLDRFRLGEAEKEKD